MESRSRSDGVSIGTIEEYEACHKTPALTAERQDEAKHDKTKMVADQPGSEE